MFERASPIAAARREAALNPAILAATLLILGARDATRRGIIHA